MDFGGFKISLGGATQPANNAATIPSGGEATPQPNGGGAADHLRASATSEVASDLAARPRRRGRPPKDAANGGSDQRALQDQVNSAIVAQLDALHDPKAWGALLGAPADAALALTGNERWKISDDERTTLGTTGSAAARTMMITNPRALAFAMLGAGLMSVYLPRMLAQLKEMKMKNVSAKKDEPAK